jgi:acetyl esterase/lipase
MDQSVVILLVSMLAVQAVANPYPALAQRDVAGARVDRDVAYGSDPAQRLDVYRPTGARDAPILFLVHGGGWRRGDKGATGVVDNKVKHWLPLGFIVVSTNYRVIPQANPLEQAGDVAKALAFVQARAKSWGGDPRRVVLMGHSAGAHLVALLTAAPEIATDQGAAPWLGTVALDGAAYDVVQIMTRPHFSLYDRAFGSDRQLWRAASPTLRLRTTPVPMLLVCSTERIASCPAARDFAARAKSLHGRASVLPVAMTHGEINGMLGTPGNYTTKVDTFMRSLGVP